MGRKEIQIVYGNSCIKTDAPGLGEEEQQKAKSLNAQVLRIIEIFKEYVQTVGREIVCSQASGFGGESDRLPDSMERLQDKVLQDLEPSWIR